MKVVQINAIYGSKSTGTIVKDIDKLLESKGHESYVVYPQATEEPTNGYKIGNKFDYKLHALLTRLLGKQAYFSRNSTKKLLNQIDKIKPDIVHLHNLHSNYIHLNMLLDYLAIKKIKTVITLHDCWFFTGKCFHYQVANCDKWKESCGDCPKIKDDVPSWFFDPTSEVISDKRKYFNKIDSLTVVGVSKWISEEAKQGIFKDNKIVTIYNGVDIDIFKPTQSEIRKELKLEDKFILIGTAEKWLDTLNKHTLEYIASNLQSDMKLIIFGCSKDQIEKLPDSVIGLGYIKDRRELVKLYSMADVFVNVTWEDSLPTVNIESLACGTPVITYESGGSPEIVNKETGLVVLQGDKFKLMNSILEVKKMGKDYYHDKCINRVFENFDKNSRYEEYIALYKE